MLQLYFITIAVSLLCCRSPGYGISLVAETTSGCFISVDTAVCYGRGEEDEIGGDERKNLIPPEDVGEQIASQLLGEIEQGGVVDSSHQVCFIHFYCLLNSLLEGLSLFCHFNTYIYKFLSERYFAGSIVSSLCIVPSRCLKSSCWEAFTLWNRST